MWVETMTPWLMFVLYVVMFWGDEQAILNVKTHYNEGSSANSNSNSKSKFYQQILS